MTAVDAHPSAVVIYERFLVPFDRVKACQLAHMGALPIIQMDPRHVRLQDIAAGKYDAYLTRYAHGVRSIGAPVAFSFGHEMNGRWYPWGYRRTPASVFVATWRHLHQVFDAAGAKNVIWLWTVDHNGSPGSRVVAPVRPWWPGSGYVNWIGVDIYYNNMNETFNSGIEPTIAAVREFTKDPILLTETAVAPSPNQQKQIANLFANVKSAHLLGFIWFDVDRRKKWYIDNRKPAISAFRKGLRLIGAR